MTCKKCMFCQIIKTLSGDKYWCRKRDKKASYKHICLGFKMKKNTTY